MFLDCLTGGIVRWCGLDPRLLSGIPSGCAMPRHRKSVRFLTVAALFSRFMFVTSKVELTSRDGRLRYIASEGES